MKISDEHFKEKIVLEAEKNKPIDTNKWTNVNV